MTTLLLLLTLAPTMAIPDASGRPAAVVCPLDVTSGVPLLRVELTAGQAAWFVVDTAATGTTLSTALAARLGLRPSGTTGVRTLTGDAQVATVAVDGLVLPGIGIAHRLVAAVHDLSAVRRVAPRAEGILGQDVLARYDYLLDFARSRLVVGAFEPSGDGVRLPLSWSAGRPVVSIDGRRGSHGLVLDSGADVLVMETEASRDTVADRTARRQRAAMDTHTGQRSVEVEAHQALRLADVRLSDVRLVRLPREAWRMSPEVGLLPAAYFSRVYVSARTGRAVVWEK
jgi:hypothetical protein